MRRQCFEGGVAGVERAREPALRREEGRKAQHPLRQRVERLVPFGERRGSVGASVDLASENRCDQVGSLREMPVDGANPDACPSGDLADGGFNARRREHFLGGLKQRIEAASRIGPQPFAVGGVPVRVGRVVSVSAVHRLSLYKRNNVPYEIGTLFRFSSYGNAAELTRPFTL